MWTALICYPSFRLDPWLHWFLIFDVLSMHLTRISLLDLQLNDEQLKALALVDIEKMLNKASTSLRNIDGMPLPSSDLMESTFNNLIHDELAYDRKQLAEESVALIVKLNTQQKQIYDSVMTAVEQPKGEIFFVYGYGGTGKTFIWRALAATLRSKGEIVLTVASSGIAALLIPGGRTAHSRFCIPISINEDSTCNIKQGSFLAELISKTKLIIWDEAPMVHRYCYEALDRTLRDILRFTNTNSPTMPFGGKVVVLGGDFRQILPVIVKGRRQQVVNASLNSSYLWNHCKVLILSENMRLQNNGSEQEKQQIALFSKWMLNIGEGQVGGENEFEVPSEFLIQTDGNPIGAIVDSTYPSLLQNATNLQYLQERAILAPTLEIVNKINDYALLSWPGDEVVYSSSDSVCKSDDTMDCAEDIYTPEFLNSISASGLPNHKLTLKVGIPVMLLRNIDQTGGLCNGTRLVITQLGRNVIEAKIITGVNAGNRVLIPRLLLTSSDIRLPFKFQRRQFPFVVCFAMTINKSQGQSLSHVGLFLPKPVFSHGQLYVAISRVTSKEGLKILITDKDGRSTNSTNNVVYKEIFKNVV